jgi:hypothetical protein
MIFAIYDFSHIQNKLDEFDLKLLLNIEDLNHIIFDEVFNSLKTHQQEQYLAYKSSYEAEQYQKERNKILPHVDFGNLPEVLDDALLKKVMMYQKDGEVRRAVFDALSEDHKTQISQLEWKIRDEREAKRRASLTEEERKKEDESTIGFNDPREFLGNIFEPGTVDEYILRYGIDPRTGKPETIENFFKNNTIDPRTGQITSKENKE